MTEPGPERLQKVIARAGVASRRAAEQLILDGQVRVNGEVVRTLGTRVSVEDVVQVEGRTLARESHVYFLLNKPAGVVTTLSDPEGRRCVGDLTREIPERVFPVGRLDYDAEGLIILTNDGDLANQLTHPRYEVERTYDAKVKGVPSEETIEQLRAGLRLGDGMARPRSVTKVGKARVNTWYRIVVTEGRPHLIKRLWDAVGHPVQRLRRVAFGGLELGKIEPGEIRALTVAEVSGLRKAGAKR